MAVLEEFIAEPPPLHRDETGTIRVGGTRVPLETIIGAWLDGATAEEMAHAYDVLRLADIHSVLSYYLRHRSAVEEYLTERQRQSMDARLRMLSASPMPAVLRERLLAERERRRG